MMPRPTMVVCVAMSVWVVLSVMLYQQTLAETSDWMNNILPGTKIESGYFFETATATHCQCKARCFVLPYCVAWSSFTNASGQLQCRLADVIPPQDQLVSDPTAVCGYDSTSVPSTTSVTTSKIETTAASTTTTTTAIPTATTTTATAITTATATTTTSIPTATATIVPTTTTTTVPTTTTTTTVPTTTTTTVPTTTTTTVPTTTTTTTGKAVPTKTTTTTGKAVPIAITTTKAVPITTTTTTKAVPSTTTTTKAVPTTTTTTTAIPSTTTTTAAAPTTTTTTTVAPTTTTTTTTTTTYSWELDYKFKRDDMCDSDHFMSAIALTERDDKLSNIEYIMCVQIIKDQEMKHDKSIEQMVSSGLEPKQLTHQRCPKNTALRDFQGWNEYDDEYESENKSWENPRYLLGVCHGMVNWQLDYSHCETVTMTSGPWTGEATDTGEGMTAVWDRWFACSKYYVVVKITREDVGGLRQLKSIECCMLVPVP